MPSIIKNEEQLVRAYLSALEFVKEQNGSIIRLVQNKKGKTQLWEGFSLIRYSLYDDEKEPEVGAVKIPGLYERVVKSHEGMVDVTGAGNSTYMLDALEWKDKNHTKVVDSIGFQTVGDWEATPYYIKAKIAPNEFDADELRLRHIKVATLQDIIKHNDTSRIDDIVRSLELQQ